MKMLDGKLSEVRYDWPKVQDEIVEQGEIFKEAIDNEEDINGEELQEISRYTLDTNEVCYINGEL